MNKKWLRIILFTSAIVSVTIWQIWFPGRAFESQAWRADIERQSGIRQAMADRLLARKSLIGLTRSETIDLLGEPTPTQYFSCYDLVYWLGCERGFLSIDSEWLVLKLGQDGRVTEALLVTD